MSEKQNFINVDEQIHSRKGDQVIADSSTRHANAVFNSMDLMSSERTYIAQLRNRPLPEEYKILISDSKFYRLPHFTFSQSAKHLIGNRLHNAEVIDLACGHPRYSYWVPDLAENESARRYIGVDKDSLWEETKHTSDGVDIRITKSGMPNILVTNDMLDFVARIPGPNPSHRRVFHVAGVQDDPRARSYNVDLDKGFREAQNPAYREALWKEIARCCKRGDIFAHSIHPKMPKPESLGFAAIETKDLDGECWIKE